MSYIPIVDPKTMEKVLFVLGFQRVRQKGGHVCFYKHPNGRYTAFHIKNLPKIL